MSKLYVGNLPGSITESMLDQFFTSAQYQVENIKLVRDMDTGVPRGFAFVQIAAGMDMQKAIQELNGQSIEGKHLVINEARPQAPRPGGGGRNSGGGHRHGGSGGFGGKKGSGGGGRPKY
jgi:cold-inducible RNA-binding protein